VRVVRSRRRGDRAPRRSLIGSSTGRPAACTMNREPTSCVRESHRSRP
jgi:hypothetical protein